MNEQEYASEITDDEIEAIGDLIEEHGPKAVLAVVLSRTCQTTANDNVPEAESWKWQTAIRLMRHVFNSMPDVGGIQ